MNNPSSNDKQDFNFNVIASSTDTNYMFDIDYSIYLKVNENNTISNDLVYVELYDKNNNILVNKTKLSDLTKVDGKDNEYVLKANNILLYNESKTNDFILRYSYVDNTKIEYSSDDTSQTGTYKSSGTFNMTVNVSMDSFEYGKIQSLSITTPPSKIEYNEGESFDKTGMVVKVNLNNNKSYEIKDYTISPSGTLKSSNKEVTISYGNKSVKQSISVKATEPNAPTLTSNMIPVYYDETSSIWKKADENNADASNKWYDYNNKMWANAVTVTSTNRQTYLNASAGTVIPMSDINTMWVWVPRYTYTYLNTNTPQSINIKFESGTVSTGTIKCTDAVTGTSSTSETCTDSTNGGLKAGTSTYTHPAFWWDKNDNNVRETGEELTGIWVGKFEISSGQIIKPNVTSLRSQTVNQLYTGIYNMRNSGNAFGFSTTDETHMMKNMEWGAVTYLSHSKYGINKEIAINSANTYTTGCGPQSEGSTSSGATCNGYTTALGQSASTTGNISGVYDMSGGACEYVMGNMVNSSGAFYSSYASFTPEPEARYYDKYSYGTSNTEYTRGKLGDATKEMAPVSSFNTSWYSDYAYFPNGSYPWFFRGGYYSNGAIAGAFHFSAYDGSAISISSSRAVLGVLD